MHPTALDLYTLAPDATAPPHPAHHLALVRHGLARRHRIGAAGRRHAARRLQALHGVVHPCRAAGADGGAAHRIAARGAPRPWQHRHRLRGAAFGCHRCVRRIHRHHCFGNPEGLAGRHARSHECRAGTAGPGRGRSAGLQRRLCARGARGRCRTAGPAHAERPGAPPRAQARPVERVHRPRRRLEGPCRALRLHADADRPRPRPGLRSRGREADRCDRHLHHRRQDRPPRPARARRRQEVLSALRRRAAATGSTCPRGCPRRGPRCRRSKAASTSAR